jgi:phospholipid/cholesterol/gamma-HCH transport system substrate-binding protein
MADIGQTDFQLPIDIRRFRIAVGSKPVAQIALSARIVDKNFQGPRRARVRGQREV